MSDIQQGYFNQVGAAAYLGVSTRYFRDHVNVEPIPFPSRGDGTVDRYARADLDAWAEAQRVKKARKSA